MPISSLSTYVGILSGGENEKKKKKTRSSNLECEAVMGVKTSEFRGCVPEAPPPFLHRCLVVDIFIKTILSPKITGVMWAIKKPSCAYNL